MKIKYIIITPVRNEETHISECISSLVNQNFDKDDYEILIVDGRSTDRTREIAREFGNKYKNITILDNPQKTAPCALNTGIAHAKGDVIVRVDGHAVITENYIRQCVDYLQCTKAECVGGVIDSINETYLGKAIALAMSC